MSTSQNVTLVRPMQKCKGGGSFLKDGLLMPAFTFLHVLLFKVLVDSKIRLVPSRFCIDVHGESNKHDALQYVETVGQLLETTVPDFPSKIN